MNAAAGLPAQCWVEDRVQAASELVAEEVPVALCYDGITHAVMLASPTDLEDFALGFSLGERIVRHARDIHDLEIAETGQGVAIDMRIASGAFMRFKEGRRARTGRTGCGLCGVESLAWFEDDAWATATQRAAQAVAPAALHRAMAELAMRQELHRATGAVHAAGWASPEGELLCMREDVGRHNALDKLVGALARDGADTGRGFAVVTSRASFEMVQKAARAGMSVLAAISAPTAMAVRLADKAGVTLAGFVRGGRHLVYTHPGRLAAAC